MSSGFISEAEIAERRRLRQEEWEKVRKSDDPEEAPEEIYDPRSLFERLEEQKQKRELEYEEAHKLKNMIKGLDDDEVEFLDLVDRTKIEQERLKCSEEAREIKDFREAVASLQEKSLEERINSEIRQQTRPVSTNTQQTGLTSLGSRSSQTRLLAGAVVRKRPADSPAAALNIKKSCSSSIESPVKVMSNQDVKPNDNQESKLNEVSENDCLEKELKKRKNRDEEDTNGVVNNNPSVGGAMQCIGILPGLGLYHDTSDSELSSDTDQDLPCLTGYDLLGRKVENVESKKVSQNSSER